MFCLIISAQPQQNIENILIAKTKNMNEKKKHSNELTHHGCDDVTIVCCNSTGSLLTHRT